jgi:hypothetical protein
LNWIGFINRSDFQIPENTTFDLVGAAIKQSETLEITSIGELKAINN